MGIISANGLNSGVSSIRPRFTVMHSQRDEENLFDRVDFQISHDGPLHLNLDSPVLWSNAEFLRPAKRDGWNGLVWRMAAWSDAFPSVPPTSEPKSDLQHRSVVDVPY